MSAKLGEHNHLDSVRLETDDPLELFKQASMADDAARFRQLLERFPAMKAKVNEPVAAFDAPVITQVSTAASMTFFLGFFTSSDNVVRPSKPI